MKEQAVLQRVAALVAQQQSSDELFAGVTEAVGRLLGADIAAMLTFSDVRSAAVIAGWTANGESIPLGKHLSLDGDSLIVRTFDTAAPARVESYADAHGETADYERSLGARSMVGAPIVVEGRLWGVLVAATRRAEPLPEATEARLAVFAGLVATAIANVEAQSKLRRIAKEQQALQNAATLVASGASPSEVFAQITASASDVFGVPFASLIRLLPDATATMVAGCEACSSYVGMSWEVPDDDPGIARVVAKTGRPARIEDHSRVAGPVGQAARTLGVSTVVGAPVVVNGATWGVLVVGAPQAGPSLPPDVAERLAGFAELVTTALSNAEAREEVRSLLDEQETLRRVATLIAQGAIPDRVFAAVCDEVVGLFGAEQAAVVHVEEESTLVVVGLSTALAGLGAGMRGITVGMRSGYGEWPTTTAACRTGRPARRDVTAQDTAGTAGPIPDLIRAAGFLSTVSAPISVDGRVWGAMVVSDSRHALPGDTERRLVNFTDLIATAIANREARDRVVLSEARARALADEQAALRRVATLAARESSPVEVLEAVVEETARVLEVDAIGMLRFEPDDTATLVAQSETPWEPPPLGTSFTLDGENLVTSIHRTGQVSRTDDWEHATGAVAGMATVLGVTSAVASPILVEGRLWGTMVASTNGSKPLPDDTESRIVEFAELLATAISNAENREALMRLADEQAALRRVATLVAAGVEHEELFSAVSNELAQLFGADGAGVGRFEPDGSAVVVVGRSESLRNIPLGSRQDVDKSLFAGEIYRTGRAARIETRPEDVGDADALGDLSQQVLAMGFSSTVAAPIVVEGELWGLMTVSSSQEMLPPSAERRVGSFAELVATAIANAESRAELAASEARARELANELLTSRARLVTAADESRRQLERDLHDGIQQWLVALALRARKAAGFVRASEPVARELGGLADDLVAVTEELREISRGIHPAILSDAGLEEALKALARRSGVPVDLDVAFQDRYDPTVEATVYYVVAESLTNAVKHAHASIVSVHGVRRDETIELEIRDDGVGGADPGGSGLIGLKDRVDTLGGAISIVSPAGAGTTIRMQLPTSVSS